MSEFRVGAYFMPTCVPCLFNSPISVRTVGSAWRDPSVGVENNCLQIHLDAIGDGHLWVSMTCRSLCCSVVNKCGNSLRGRGPKRRGWMQELGKLECCHLLAAIHREKSLLWL